MPEIFPFPHPTDINWANISSKYINRWFRRILFNLIMIALLIFFTTPAAFVAIFSNEPTSNTIFPHSFVNNLSTILRFLFTGLIPALIVLIVNEILILLIGKVIDFKRRTRFSTHQVSRLRTIFIYLFFNSVVVPGFASSAFANIYQDVKQGNHSFNDFVIKLFTVRTGDYFLVFILGGAGSAFMTVMNYLSFLLKNYMSPLVAIQFRTFSRQGEHWLRENGNMWGYASNYALTCVYTGIAIIFQ